MLHYSSVDVDGDVCVATSSPGVHKDFPGFLDVNGQAAVGKTRGQVLDLVPVGNLIPSQQAYIQGVMWKLYYGVIMVLEHVQERSHG